MPCASRAGEAMRAWRSIAGPASRLGLSTVLTARAKGVGGAQWGAPHRAFVLHWKPVVAAAPRLQLACGGASMRSASSAAPELVVAPKVTPPGIVNSFKEELWRRQKVASTYFSHPVAAFEEVKPDAGTTELAAAVFQEAERLDILNRVVLWQRAKKRVVARAVKTRAMTQGGGKKPWRQKGSGRARHGSIRCAAHALRLHLPTSSLSLGHQGDVAPVRAPIPTSTMVTISQQVAYLEGRRKSAWTSAALVCLRPSEKGSQTRSSRSTICENEGGQVRHHQLGGSQGGQDAVPEDTTRQGLSLYSYTLSLCADMSACKLATKGLDMQKCHCGWSLRVFS